MSTGFWHESSWPTWDECHLALQLPLYFRFLMGNAQSNSALLAEPPMPITELHVPSRPSSRRFVLLTASSASWLFHFASAPPRLCAGLSCMPVSVTLCISVTLPPVSLGLSCYSNLPGSPLNSLLCPARQDPAPKPILLRSGYAITKIHVLGMKRKLVRLPTQFQGR